MANQASVPQNQWSPAMRQVLADIRQSLASPSARRPASSRLVPHVLATLTSTDGPHYARLSPAEKAGLLVGSWRLLRRLRELHSAVFPVQSPPVVAGTSTSPAAAVAALSSDAAAVTSAYAKKQLCLGDGFYVAETRPLLSPNAVRLMQHIAYSLNTSTGADMNEYTHTSRPSILDAWTVDMLADCLLDTSLFYQQQWQLFGGRGTRTSEAQHDIDP
jgi:hypothetical protein